MYGLFRVLLLSDRSVTLTKELLIGIAKFVKENGSWLIQKDLSNYLRQKPHSVYTVKKIDVDGVICLNLPVDNESIITRIIKSQIPILVKGTNRKFSGAINFISNNDLIAKVASDHLLCLGLRNFGYYGHKEFQWSKQRYKSFDKYITKAGYKVDLLQSSYWKSGDSFDLNIKELIEWLNSLPKPVGIMACNDDFGMTLLECCQIAGFSVPDDIAVIGVDNDECICELCSPSLTSISRDAQKAGYEGAKLLDSKMRNKVCTKNEVVIETTHVQERRSSNMLAVFDPEIVKALNYIKENIMKGISVDDVVDCVMVSRRNLDLKFTKYFGRTVHQEITRFRLEKISELLLTTNLSIYQIALKCGFNSNSHICAYFLRNKGISPGLYRTQNS